MSKTELMGALLEISKSLENKQLYKQADKATNLSIRVAKTYNGGWIWYDPYKGDPDKWWKSPWGFASAVGDWSQKMPWVDSENRVQGLYGIDLGTVKGYEHMRGIGQALREGWGIGGPPNQGSASVTSISPKVQQILTDAYANANQLAAQGFSKQDIQNKFKTALDQNYNTGIINSQEYDSAMQKFTKEISTTNFSAQNQQPQGQPQQA